MAYILCIETATPVCSVALFKETNLIALTEITDQNAHASILTSLIEQCLAEALIQFHMIDAIAISKGPGSYTGLRVGLATAKSLCFTLGKPLLAIDSLEGLAHSFMMNNPGYTGLICPMIDAKRMEVYTSVFDDSLLQLTPTDARVIDETSFSEELKTNVITFIGSGADKCRGIISHKGAFFYSQQSSANGLGKVALAKYESGKFENLAYFEPAYLKEFDQKIR